MNVSYSDGYVGLAIRHKTEYVNSTQYAKLYNEALFTITILKAEIIYTEEEIGYFRDGSNPIYIKKTQTGMIWYWIRTY